MNDKKDVFWTETKISNAIVALVTVFLLALLLRVGCGSYRQASRDAALRTSCAGACYPGRVLLCAWVEQPVEGKDPAAAALCAGADGEPVARTVRP